MHKITLTLNSPLVKTEGITPRTHRMTPRSNLPLIQQLDIKVLPNSQSDVNAAHAERDDLGQVEWALIHKLRGTK